jgi:hypothetical protein
MGVIKLDHDLFREMSQVGMKLFEAIEYIVDCCRSEKILLLETELSPLLDIVGRVENLGDVLRSHLFFQSPDIIPFVKELEIELP